MDPQDFDIRPLTLQDAPAWRALRLKALKDHPTAFLASYEETSVQTVEEMAGRIPAPGSPDVIFGLFAGGRLVGSAGFFQAQGLKVRHKGGMWGVYVHPDARGRGGAGALVAAVIAHARGCVEVLQAAVLTTNAAARTVYLRAGFRSMGFERRCMRIDGVYYDDELLWLPLDEEPGSLPKPGLSDRRAP